MPNYTGGGALRFGPSNAWEGCRPSCSSPSSFPPLTSFKPPLHMFIQIQMTAMISSLTTSTTTHKTPLAAASSALSVERKEETETKGKKREGKEQRKGKNIRINGFSASWTVYLHFNEIFGVDINCLLRFVWKRHFQYCFRWNCSLVCIQFL